MDDDITIKEYDKPLPKNIEGLEKSLKDVSNVVGVQHRLSEKFVELFLDYFGDTPLSTQDNLNKSNWTHHVYFAIRSAAKTLYFGCTFEIMGRLDAVIYTLENYPGVILVAEWESDSSSIFGKDNELEKLWHGTQAHQNADGFLLTYCDIEKLQDFTKQVVQYWQSQKNNRESAPSLFLIVVVCKQDKRNQKFLFIRSLEIQSSSVFLWHDLAFVTGKEYLESIESL